MKKLIAPQGKMLIIVEEEKSTISTGDVSKLKFTGIINSSKIEGYIPGTEVAFKRHIVPFEVHGTKYISLVENDILGIVSEK